MKTSIKQFFIFSLFTILTIAGKTQTYIPYDSCFYFDDDVGGRTLCIVNDTLLVAAEGMFTAGGITTNFIAQWDGQHFHAMGSGTNDNGGPEDAVYYNDTVFVVGGFTNMGGYLPFIAPWYQGHWTQPIMTTPSFTSTIYSVEEWHDTLFFGSSGITINGSNYYNLFARTPNGQFFQVDGLYEKVWDMAIYNDKLYTVGWYYLQEYNPATNHCDITGDFNGYPEAMKVDTINNFLYIAGQFTGAGIGNSVVYTDNVVRWNGFYLENIGTGINGIKFVDAVELYRGDLYIGGSGIDTLSNTFVGASLARWDGQQWHYVGPYPGVKGMTIRAIKSYKDTLYVGGTYAPGYSYPMVGTDTVTGLIRFYKPPDTTCHWLQPRVLAHADTFYLPQGGGTVDVPLYNNNAYADSWQWDFDDGSTDTVKDPLHTYSQIGTYHVQVTVTEDGCTKTAEKDIVILEATGIADLSLKDLSFKIYPNPTKQDFTVEISLPENIKGKNEFFVAGMNGVTKYRRHLQSGFNRFVVSTTGWQPATYICNLTAGNKFVGSKKLVLTK